MELREAIIHAIEVKERCKSNNKECACQHAQLAEWLDELARMRETFGVLDNNKACCVCGKYRNIVFTGYKTTEDVLSLGGSSMSHISGRALFCPRCGKKL